MSELQIKIWDMLTELDGETVARLFTNYYGNKLLTEEFFRISRRRTLISRRTRL